MAKGKIPDFFLVGAPKCGTTSMNDHLRQHPEIFMPPGKEFHHFGSDLKKNPKYRSTDEYLSLFADVKDEKRVGEASVLSLYSRVAAKEIKNFNPDSRILIMLRNPVDMLFSYHAHLYYSHIEDIVDFRAALEKEASRRQPFQYGDDGYECKSYENTLDLRVYRDVVKYSEQVKRYFDAFGRENVRVIIFDDFKNDTPGVYRKTLEFLDVDTDFRPNFRVLNPNRAFFGGGSHRVVWRPPRLLRSVARRMLSREQRDWLTGLVFHRLMSKFAPRATRDSMDPELKAELRKQFVPEIEKLSALLGRDLSHWTTP